jgi:hypothetical protein
LKFYETNKLFYNQYLYKINIWNELGFIFRTEFQKKGTLSYARKHIDILTESYRARLPLQLPRFRTFNIIREEHYLDAKHLYVCLRRDKHDHRVRVEYNGISIFTNDYELIEKISSGLRTNSIEVWKPNDSVKNELLLNENIIISNTPTDWTIKVTFSNSRGDYTGFANWIKANPSKIRIGDVALNALSKGWDVSGYYFFIQSEKLLNLIHIMIGTNIRRIERIVYKADLDK